MPLCQPLIRHLKSPDLFGALDRMPALATPIGKRTFDVLNPSTGDLLAEHRYGAPRETAKPVFETIFTNYRRLRNKTKLKIIDIGCSYGVNAALLRTDLDFDDLYSAYLGSEQTVQLCTMRQTGRLLSENEQPPAAAIRYLAEQLGIDARL